MLEAGSLAQLWGGVGLATGEAAKLGRRFIAGMKAWLLQVLASS